MDPVARTRVCGAWHTSRMGSASSLTGTCTPRGPPAAWLQSPSSYRAAMPARDWLRFVSPAKLRGKYL